MSNLKKQIKEELIQSIKDGTESKSKRDTLRLLVAEIEKEEIELKNHNLTDEQVQNVISRQIKKLDKEIEAYIAVNRITEKQEVERKLLLSYLPKQLTEAEIREVVYHSISLVSKGEIKNPMQYLSQRLKGKADMGHVSKIVKELSK